MEPISLLASIASVIGAAFAYDKIKSIYKLLSKKDEYEDALNIHKIITESIELEEDIERHEKIIKRIIINDKDIGDVERLKKTYSLIFKSKDLSEVEIKCTVNATKDHKLISAYFTRNLMLGRSSAIGIALNSGLISSLLQNFLSATDRSAINRSTIVGMLVGKKVKEDTRSYIYLFLALVAHLGAVLLGLVGFNLYITGFLILMIAALAMNQKALEYRIKYGLYGSTPYEVRELIKFIEEHTDKDDFNDHEGRKKIFQDAIEEAPKEVIVYGGAYQ